MFNKRFANGIPSLIDCNSLKIIGDVFFEGNVKIKGNVVINNRSGSQAVIKEGTVIEKDINFDRFVKSRRSGENRSP
jgi:UTP--glucose-1-phosphate uridylyltransferase